MNYNINWLCPLINSLVICLIYLHKYCQYFSYFIPIVIPFYFKTISYSHSNTSQDALSKRSFLHWCSGMTQHISPTLVLPKCGLCVCSWEICQNIFVASWVQAPNTWSIQPINTQPTNPNDQPTQLTSSQLNWTLHTVVILCYHKVKFHNSTPPVTEAEPLLWSILSQTAGVHTIPYHHINGWLCHSSGGVHH